MALKFIPQSWRDDMRTNPFTNLNFYLNPRCRTIPALTEAGVSYIKNDVSTNMRGTYRMQCGGSTDLTYLYTLPQRFIIEGWFKPEFAYDIGVSQTIFGSNIDSADLQIRYNFFDDSFLFVTRIGGISTALLQSDAFISTVDLQKWIYLRGWFDNIAKLKGLYMTCNGVSIADSTGTPGAGAFGITNIQSFFPTVATESSYWIIHELDETLATGEYKTYQADRQIIFDFNGTTLARERIRIPRNSASSDMRGVKSFNYHAALENELSGSACANTAGLTLYNIKGQFCDDQYDAFDPFQGYYNGTLAQKYLQNRVGIEIETHAPAAISAYDYQGYCEPLFIGRTTPGAFRRSSPSKFYGAVSIEAEDGVAELGETKLTEAHAFETYDLCDPAAESDSLVHSIARLVTKKPIVNYALNSSFENATIGNSWLNTGMATFERSNTYAQFGTYSMKCVADAAGDKVTQVIKFETNDLIDIDDTFNFSAFIRQGTASTVKIQIEELDNTGSLIGSASETACGTDIDVFTRVNVARTILSSSCTQLRITFYAVDASTFYVDGVMLTRGIDPIDYFLVNANDGSSGIGSAESYATYSYDTVAIDADAVDIEHPYALVKKDDTVWDHLKKLADASIGYKLGMSPDGVLEFKNRYAEAGTSTPANLGDVENFGGISTSLEVESSNAIKIHGYAVSTGSLTQLWSAENASGIILNTAGKPYHPISDGAYMSVNGATTFDATYSDSEGK
jgi:hypothetical protein